MALIPTAWKIGGALALVLLLGGGYLAWAAHQRALGAAAVELADAKAVIRQHEADAKANAVAVQKLADALARTEATVITVTEKVHAAPVTRDCAQSPAMRAASDGLRQLFPPAGGQADDRRQPAAAVR